MCTPTKPKGGPPLLINTPKRKALVELATSDSKHRRMSYEEVAEEAGVQACSRTLTRAFAKEGYYRRIAAKKPMLTDKHKVDRLAWAHAHKQWDFSDWCRVNWTDESSFTTGGFGDTRVTRKAGEKFLDDCLLPKYRGYSAAMIHGNISGLRKGPLLVFDKTWGTITGALYQEKVTPHIYAFLEEIEQAVGEGRAILMEDNASVHKAGVVKRSHTEHGVYRMEWPANSPDLNPIENVWRLMKYRVGKYFPKTTEEVRQRAQEEWESMEVEDFVKYIASMPDRCAAVIEAKGGHTKW